MDQARSTISKIFNGEPHLYTRFNLTQNMEGDNSQVEMKLSTDADEEVGGNGVGEHLNHNSHRNSVRKTYATQTLGRTSKNLCLMAATAFLIFIIGYLIGYVVHRKKDAAPVCDASVLRSEAAPAAAYETGAAPLMNWDDVKALLSQKLTASRLESALRDFSSEDHRAGSYGDEGLANKVHERFKSYRMKTWTDEHFVKVQDPPASGYNSVVFKNNPEERPKGFLSYSKTGSASGAVLYGHYGQRSELRLLTDKNINVSGRVLLLRAGKISFAEKVANAAEMNASAVLIYPDRADYSFGDDVELYGHVHLGSGDPYTPGFPSFNHTQFPPVQSSGLPQIPAQTITQGMAIKILRNLSGQSLPAGWDGFNKLGDVNDTVTVKVDNVLVEKKITNVFGVIKGFVDSDRYLVIGAQRDAWGPGYASSTVGTSVLVELARSISEMVNNDGFKPRRSIVFASWSAGEYGNVGATEWMEGYLTSLGMKTFSYINLDGIVTGQSGFKVAASPLMNTLIENALKEVKNKDVSLFSQFARNSWESEVLEPMSMSSAAYPFLAFSGIPSMSFRFTTGNPGSASSFPQGYQYLGTLLDTLDKLNAATSIQVPQLAETAGRFAGHVALRLVHDHLLQMNLRKYDGVIRSHVAKIKGKVVSVQTMQLLPRALTANWLIMASGSFGRAARSLTSDIANSNLEDIEFCRIINDRIMTVERSFLSPYVSPTERPFRHILLGSGPHTLTALAEHLDALKTNSLNADLALFQNQLALATWTIQGCANSLAGDVWALDNEI